MTTTEKAPNRIELEKPIIVGECPRCEEKGDVSNLILYKGINKIIGKPFEFARCETCEFTQHAHNGKLLPVVQCPECDEIMSKRSKDNGQHYWNCPYCKTWMLADENFQVVEPPVCDTHKQPLKHTCTKTDPNSFYWYCPIENCSHIIESDKYGKITYRYVSTILRQSY